MIDAPLAYAFTVGMVATVNPCGFALLPAYLSWFLGVEPGGGDARASVGRALAVGASVSAGFVVVFAVVGLLVRQVSSTLLDGLPWVGLVIGIGLVVLGAAMLLGKKVSVPVPALARRGADRGLGSMVAFGISYAVASLGCTISLFLAAVGTTFTDGGLLSGLASFVAYALGMGLVLTAVTVALALARTSVVRSVRQASRHVERVAAVALLLAGAYVTWYWASSLADDAGSSGVIRWVEGLSADLGDRLESFGAARVFALLALALGAAGWWAWGSRRRDAERV